MARLISRQDAAELLGCSFQTVTNWVNRGVINGHIVDNHLMVDSDSINRLFDDLKELAQMEQQIKELNNNCKAVLDEFKGSDISSERARIIFRDNQLTLIDILEDNLKFREGPIIKRIVKGESFEEIGKDLGLTSERVAQIGAKAAQKLSDISEIKKIKDENILLKQENERLKRDIADVVEQLSEYKNGNKLESTIFQLQIRDIDLSVRTKNALGYYGCETVGDFVKLNKSILMKARNFGKKSLDELEEFLNANNLQWGMNPDKMSVEELKAWHVDNIDK